MTMYGWQVKETMSFFQKRIDYVSCDKHRSQIRVKPASAGKSSLWSKSCDCGSGMQVFACGSRKCTVSVHSVHKKEKYMLSVLNLVTAYYHDPIPLKLHMCT